MNVSSKFDVFISYNSSDHATVERVARALTERGLKVFLDRWELVAGRSWPDTLEGHLSRCGSVVVAIGPSGMGSWQHREHYLALDRQTRDASFRVLPVLLPGADPALGFLSLNTWIDLRQGMDDSLSMDLLASAVRGQPPAALLEQSRRTIAEICPYRGLEVFREEDAPFFFGRESFTQLLLERVEARDFVAVVGASGSGKSSVVRAGLVPALRRSPHGTIWDVLTMVPGNDPIVALARVLDPPPPGGLIAARAHLNAAAATLRERKVTLSQLITDHLAQQPGTDRLLLIVDQFEELVTLARDGVDQARFVDLLLEATGEGGALSVLLTLRSDFYTELVRRRDLNDRLQNGVVNIGPLSREPPKNGLSELEMIIRRPAEAVELDFADGLVPRIIGDVGAEPGNLPLLEYLLTELWRRRARGLLTHEAYEDLGGVKGAIARRAEDAYEGLDPKQQRAARRLFLSLVRPGEGQEDTRLRARFPEDPLEAEVARRFCGARIRLLVADEDALQGRVVEVGHEALIRNWSTLRRWVDHNRETLRTRERVRQRMQRWRDKSRPTDLLLPSGLELEEGRRLLELDTDVSMDEIRSYIKKSISEEELRVAADQARLEAERQRELALQRQKRRSVISALVVSLVLLALSGWQWRRAETQRKATEKALELAESARDRAKRQATRADREADLAVAQRLASTAAQVLNENPGETALAAMLAVESQARRNNPEANSVLRDVLNLTPLKAPLIDFPWVSGETQISADGRVQVFEHRGFWDPSSQETEARSSVHTLKGANLESVSSRRFGGYVWPIISPDGRWLVSAGYGRKLVVTDFTTGDVVLEEPTRSASFPVFAPDSRTLYVARQTGVIEIRRAPSWRIAGKLEFPVAGARNVGLEVGITADGSRLLVIDYLKAAFVVPTDESPVKRLELDVDELKPKYYSNRLSSGMVSPLGLFGLTRQRQGRTKLWNLRTGSKLMDFDDEDAPASSTFSPDGQLVATANRGGVVFLRRVGTGAMVHRWQHNEEWKYGEDWIRELAFSTAGDLLASAGDDGVIMIWDTESGALQHRLQHDAPILALAFDSVDGSLLAGCEDGMLIRFDVRSGDVLAQKVYKGAVANIAIGGPGRMLAIGVRETSQRNSWDDVTFIQRATGTQLSHITWNGRLISQTISPDGSRFAAFDPAHEEVRIWNTATGETVLKIPILKYAPSIEFSPDGRRLLLHVYNGPLLVFNAKTGDMLFELGEPGGVSKVFGTAHTDIAITRGTDDSLRGWNLLTGESQWHTAPGKQYFQVSPDGGTFASYAKAEHAIQVFKSATGKQVGSISMAPPGSIKLNDGGSRLLTQRSLKDAAGGNIKITEIEIWDVRTGRLIQRKWIDSQHAFTRQNSGSYIALSGPPIKRNGQWLAWMDLVDWETGRVSWSLSEKSGGSYDVGFVDPARDRILVEPPSAAEMRSLTTGDLIWRNSGRNIRAAADLSGSELIALAKENSGLPNDDVILLVERESGAERRRVIAGGLVRDVAATADGKYIIAAVENEHWRGLRVWRIDDGGLIREIEMDALPLRILPLSDPDRVAVHDLAQNLRIFDLRTGEQVHRIAHTRSAEEVAYAHGADRAVTVAGASLRYWDTETGREMAHRISHGDARSVNLSPDGARVAYLTSRPRNTNEGAEFRAAVVWTPESNAEPVFLPVKDVSQIRFDPTGRYLALQGGKKFVHLVDARTLLTKLTVLRLRNGEIEDVDFAAEGDVLLVRETGNYNDSYGSSHPFSLRAFEIETGKESIRLDGGSRAVPVSDSREVIFRDVHRRLRCFNLSNLSLDTALTDDHPGRLVPASQSTRILGTSYPSGTLVYDMANRQSLELTSMDEAFEVTHAGIDPTGRFVALSRRERYVPEDSSGEIVIMDASNGDELARLKTKEDIGKTQFVNGGDAVVFRTRDYTNNATLPKGAVYRVVQWNWRTGIAKNLVSVNNPIVNFAVSPFGNRLATNEGYQEFDSETGQRAGTVGKIQFRIWNCIDGSEIACIPLDFDHSDIAFSTDGRHVAVSGPFQVLLVRVADGSEVERIRVRNQLSNSPLGFAAEGRVLVIEGRYGALLFDIPTRSKWRLRHTEPVSRTVISNDGSILAMQGDRFISVWDIATREMLIRFEALDVKNFTFGGKSGQELFAVRDGNIVRLRWRPEELRELACKTFADGDWRRGRARVIGESGPHPCDEKPAVNQK